MYPVKNAFDNIGFGANLEYFVQLDDTLHFSELGFQYINQTIYDPLQPKGMSEGWISL
jgi:hypothetical protein